MIAVKKIAQKNVYVVRLAAEAAQDKRILRQNPDRDPSKPCIYVGLTGLSVAERYQNHKRGHKCARVVKRYGVGLMPDLYEHLNPMPWQAAAQMEKDLAEDLRSQGYTVTGGY